MCSAACSTSATIPTGADNIGMIEYIYIYIPAMFAVTTINAQLTYHHCTQVGVHSTVQRTNRFYSVDPAVCTLGYKCSTLKHCRLYWRECVGHL